MKAPTFLISGILSWKFVASGQQQKVRGTFADHDHDKHNSLPQHTVEGEFVSNDRNHLFKKTTEMFSLKMETEQKKTKTLS